MAAAGSIRYATVRCLLPVVLFLACGVLACGSEEQEQAQVPIRQVSPQRILTYEEQQAPYLRVRTREAVLPGGWAVAMAPVMVDWANSDVDSSAGMYRIMNLNHGGNPMDGTTVLCSALVPTQAIDRVEFIIVPLDPLGQHGIVAHAMIRFIFAPEHPLILLDSAGTPLYGNSGITDLILSWEAWRAPGVDFQALVGFDPKTYGLTMRAYSGSQRFLEDYLQDRDWYAYPLALTGGQSGNAELLRVMLAMGDGAARRILDGIFSRSETAWLQHGPGEEQQAEDAWGRLQNVVLQGMSAEDSLLFLPPNELSYQTAQRSCATMALYCIDVTVARLLDPDHPGKPTLDEAIGPIQPWMKEIAHANLLELFLRAPVILKFMTSHHQIIPTRIPGILDHAGLVQHRDGHMIKIHYSLDDTPPYGDIRSNLIR